jgi:hypothetical protein
MTPDQAAVWSAVGAIASAVAAGCALYVAWQAKRVQSNSVDFANCLTVAQRLSETQRAVRDAAEENKQFEFIELLNFMEILALLVNAGRSTTSTRKVVSDYLEEALAWIGITPWIAELMENSTTGEGTYGELKKFRAKRAKRIREKSRHYITKRDTAI